MSTSILVITLIVVVLVGGGVFWVVKKRKSQVGSDNEPDYIDESTFSIVGKTTIVFIFTILIVNFLVGALIGVCDEEFERFSFNFVKSMFVMGFSASLNFVLVLILSLIITWIYGRNSDKKKTKSVWLYICFFIALAMVCNIVNLTGGLTSSPFTSLYAGMITTTILVYNKVKALVFTGALIVVSLIINLILQRLGQHGEWNTDCNTYQFTYLAVTSIVIISLGWVEFRRGKRMGYNGYVKNVEQEKK